MLLINSLDIDQSDQSGVNESSRVTPPPNNKISIHQRQFYEGGATPVDTKELAINDDDDSSHYPRFIYVQVDGTSMDNEAIANVLLQFRHANGMDNNVLLRQQQSPSDLLIHKLSQYDEDGKTAPFNISPTHQSRKDINNGFDWIALYNDTKDQRAKRPQEMDTNMIPNYFDHTITSYSWRASRDHGHVATDHPFESTSDLIKVDGISFNCLTSYYDLDNKTTSGYRLFSSISDSSDVGSVETMMMDINHVENYPLLMRNLFLYEKHVQRTIIIVGPCSIKTTLEVYLDLFIMQNRLWRYNSNIDNVCDYDDESRETGIIAILKKDRFRSKQEYLQSLDNMRFSTSVWKQTFQLQDGGGMTCETVNGATSMIAPHGMFSDLHSVTRDLHIFSFKKLMTVEDTKNFPYIDQWDDYLLPLASCTEAQIRDANHKRGKKIPKHDNRPIMPPAWIDITVRSLEMDYLLRPNYLIRRLLFMFKKGLWDTQRPVECAAVHIRNGDKAAENVVYYLEDYMNFFTGRFNLSLSMPELYNHKNIFLMTNNNTINSNNNLLKQYPLYNFTTIREPFQFNDQLTNALVMLNATSNVKFSVGVNILLQTLIASQCQYFVGTLSSNVGRAIIELMIGNQHLLTQSQWLSVDGSKYVFYP
ncbi:hypothetical protein SAMD00019534_035260 [Acytostelium subglobosum LB1]|uniref:hypothetical protein n=1 Tax=Acytostelium subglobosum LB1 TaxID=1410327 RepID=UPI0006449759|nr:hypothetical protein SAMD00019534_035260 [Acytostelium subglobosum LB1]GAM20351.1 hypothetical protein SAMD00019534_035260 [Acytostelium subglobosum LB1]|eukprot:XP_012759872.1 hypothetical protein SAMD00019534_035260 [Acytostelium subglobosum LB1]